MTDEDDDDDDDYDDDDDDDDERQCRARHFQAVVLRPGTPGSGPTGYIDSVSKPDQGQGRTYQKTD
jgi:hypothetical protein